MLRHYYLVDTEQKDDRHFKLLLSETDRDTLIAIVKQKEVFPQEPSVRLNENYNWLKPELFTKALAKL